MFAEKCLGLHFTHSTFSLPWVQRVLVPDYTVHRGKLTSLSHGNVFHGASYVIQQYFHFQIDNAEKQRQNDIAEMTNLIGDLEKDVRELIFDFDEVAEVIANI